MEAVWMRRSGLLMVGMDVSNPQQDERYHHQQHHDEGLSQMQPQWMQRQD